MNSFWNLLSQSLTVNALPALVASLALLGMSLLHFSRTGPRIREEIILHYRAYTAGCVLRQALWAFLILFWLGGFGQLGYLALVAGGRLAFSWPGSLLAGSIAIAILAGFQFLRHLLHIPAALMMSWPYDIRRLYPLWRRLTVTRLRWLGLALAGGWLGLLVWGLEAADAAARNGLLAALGLWLLPVLMTLEFPALPRRHRRAGKRPNLLLIGCDTLRADRISADYPRNVAPFLKTLAQRGTLFTRCYTPIARTAPSLATLLTGTDPQKHGVVFNFMGDDSTTLPVKALPRILAEHGYHTEAISDWSGSDLGKFSFGFHKTLMPADQWNFRYLLRQGPKELRLFLGLFSHNCLGRWLLPELYYLAGAPLTGQLGRLARKRLSALGRHKQPFCLTLFLGTCHPPFGSEYPYYRFFADPNYRGASLFAMARLTDPMEILRSQQEPREAFDLDQIIDLYDGCVRRFDDEVRAICHHLQRCGLDRDTIVVVFSDHGMELFEHGTWGQGNSAIGEQSNRIPVLIFDPRQPGRGRIDGAVRATDLVPTLLDLIDISPPSHLDGVSLKTVLSGQEPLPELAATFRTGLWLTRHPGMSPSHLAYPDLVELLHIPDRRSGTLAIQPQYRQRIEKARDVAVCRGRWKLVRLALNPHPRYLLFDLETDPGCHEDVSDRHPDIVAALKSYLD
ncbi:hypothetical protein MIT9_P1723 [Methylomarinovum caldicuralii]|uniref:Sulfatase N-terminal domain-containing protein n=1 Tax=Methylomarinovum caldicuralii TaxID=438856 RepID=A0AAU9C3A0_9GAMM|nr:sulfatase [Methylomarinovum caldicuralii]BCX82138.1 hypothetical protein MIT9_P1723 [Methylomarinovum caldicuralii]